MLNPGNIPPVASQECLARFILFSKHVRRSDSTVKPDAFIPHPQPELSLTRHLEATEDELWREGERVAVLREVTLYGRADAIASTFEGEGLAVVARPIPENPNHADVINWPPDKSAQKMKAMVIAGNSKFLPSPDPL